VTPHLSGNNTLLPTPPGTVPDMVRSSPFPTPPEPSAMPPVPAPEQPLQPPTAMPDLPAGTEALPPPPVRDTIKPSPALKTTASGKVIPGNHVVLPDDLSTISFKPGVENIDTDALPILDKLALILQSDSSERITLTSYAGVGPDTSPRDARRLSLTRALAIRDYLTAKGVVSARINVRALGANVPSGDPDRVDVKAE
jgi:outer membrane protein OmpA-like peptidoglycan-associated protein